MHALSSHSFIDSSTFFYLFNNAEQWWVRGFAEVFSWMFTKVYLASKARENNHKCTGKFNSLCGSCLDILFRNTVWQWTVYLLQRACAMAARSCITSTFHLLPPPVSSLLLGCSLLIQQTTTMHTVPVMKRHADMPQNPLPPRASQHTFLFSHTDQLQNWSKPPVL